MVSDLFELLPQVKHEQGPWVLVSMVETEGSTYRSPGAHLLIHPKGTVGMLSGGCLEAEVVSRCQPVLSGEQRVLSMEIDTRRLLGCHGVITLVAEALPQDLVEQVGTLFHQRKTATLYTSLPGPGWMETSFVPREHAYRHELEPPIRLLVFGSGPGVPPLLHMAKVLGWQTEQVVLAQDPAIPRNPQAGWTILPSAASARKLVDARTACIVMNHHVGRDTETLLALWETPTPFLGMLGSRRRRDEILERIAFTVDLESRILHAPVGLNLEAEGAAEIALEVCAQVQRELALSGMASKKPAASRAV